MFPVLRFYHFLRIANPLPSHISISFPPKRNNSPRTPPTTSLKIHPDRRLKIRENRRHIPSKSAKIRSNAAQIHKYYSTPKRKFLAACKNPPASSLLCSEGVGLNSTVAGITRNVHHPPARRFPRSPSSHHVFSNNRRPILCNAVLWGGSTSAHTAARPPPSPRTM